MRKSAKLITALSVAGLAVVAGSAFTGTGVTKSDSAALDQFVGGTVSQAVAGANLTTVEYGYFDDAQNYVNGITLTFTAGANDRIVDADPIGGTGGTFDCSVITNNVSTCAFDPALAEDGYLGLSRLDVTVS